MLTLLPLITFALTFLCLNGWHTRHKTNGAGWQLAFLQTAAILGAFMAVFMELLSLFNTLTTFWVALFWVLAILGVALWGWKTGLLLEGKKNLVWFEKPDWFDVAAGGILGLILVLLFIIAIKSPTNNNDSLYYHMSRVAHWVQNESLHHYPTGYIHQLAQPIQAELSIFNIFLLKGDDGFSNLIQWMSLIGVLVGVSAISALLGAGKAGQWAAVVFVASLPIGILQATSTQNDYVSAFWLVSLLYFIFRSVKIKAGSADISLIGLCFGLGLLTKGTLYPYVTAPMLYFVISQFRDQKFRKVLFHGMIVALLAISLNAGYWLRNMISFDTPLGPKTFITKHAAFSAGTIVGGPVRNVLLNFVTPEESLNASIVAAAKSIFSPMDPAMENFNLGWAWNHEDMAGNPIHMGLVFISIIALILLRNKITSKWLRNYTLVVLAMFILFSATVRFDLFGVRYQLPFFSAFAPVFGIALESLNWKRFALTVSILLLITAFPWVLFNRTRPLIAMRESSDPFTVPCFAGCTAGSILNESPENTLLAVWSETKDDYILSMQMVKQTACTQIGLKLDSSDLEYAYWWLLDAPQPGLRLESIDTFPELKRYLDPNFKPCVIICTACRKDQLELNGLSQIGEFHRIKIFALPGYKP